MIPNGAAMSIFWCWHEAQLFSGCLGGECAFRRFCLSVTKIFACTLPQSIRKPNCSHVRHTRSVLAVSSRVLPPFLSTTPLSPHKHRSPQCQLDPSSQSSTTSWSSKEIPQQRSVAQSQTATPRLSSWSSGPRKSPLQTTSSTRGMVHKDQRMKRFDDRFILPIVFCVIPSWCPPCIDRYL